MIPAECGQRYPLDIIADNGTVSISPSKSTYAREEEVALYAETNSGYSFSHWSGDLSGSGNPETITMDADKTITANFVPNEYKLTLLKINGSVTKEPDKDKYLYEEEVTLTAVPDPGYLFTMWGRDLFGSENPTTIIMDSNKQVIANFAPTNIP